MAEGRLRMKNSRGTIMEAPLGKVGRANLEKIRKARPETWKGARITEGIQMRPSEVRAYRPYLAGSKYA